MLVTTEVKEKEQEKSPLQNILWNQKSNEVLVHTENLSWE